MKHIGFLLCFLCLTAISAMAQDAVKVDPKHYTVEFENDQVRVLRIRYSPHEKSVMHSHPAGVVIMLTDTNSRFTFPDGKTEEMQGKAGQVLQAEAVTHLPENLGDQLFEAILVELKAKPAKSSQSKKP
ncbi:MAG: cytoplasmic protein [Acidobacteriota bacterium]|nr:cytoplasmic protein [Acidobacteriota bacterium]